MLLASIGLIRFPDVFSRMHASGKAATVGIASLFIAVAIHFSELSIISQIILIITFLFLTAPLGTHMMAKAAFKDPQKRPPVFYPKPATTILPTPAPAAVYTDEEIEPEIILNTEQSKSDSNVT
ncbi:MAG: monovalent cation/H(+) antiporter subunit G [Bacteriovoracaceae bacterium]|nr:monovalent cation/H(+) antiporter subunit G [Bacteriovoracaceae bacterium]